MVRPRAGGPTDPPADLDLEMTRRGALAAVPAALAAGAALGQNGAEKRALSRPRLAAIVTEYTPTSHAQGMVDRLMDGYGWEGRHYRPRVDVVSLYVDQKPRGDLTAERAARHAGLKVYPTIAEALTRGGEKLDVDGVLSIAEFGDYPRNEKGQRLYPRYEFFQQIVEVFRRSGRAVPVFNDKHLSWNWEWARTMVETSRALGFPFMAGSSLPVTWRLPAVEVPLGAEVSEAVCVGYGGLDSYDFHGLEALQCMVERRKGGETGVKAVQALRGPAVWKALAAETWDAGGCDRELFEACLCRSFRLASPLRGYGHVFPTLDQFPELARDPMMFRIEHVDGLKATLLMLSGLVRDFTVALRLGRAERPLSTQMYLPGISPNQTLPNFFSPLMRHVETMFHAGKPTYSVERTLLTTGVLAAAIDSLHRGQTRAETPDLRRIQYAPPRGPLFVNA